MKQTKHTKISQNGTNGNYIAILTQRVHWKDGGYDDQLLDMRSYKTLKGAEKKLKQWGDQHDIN